MVYAPQAYMGEEHGVEMVRSCFNGTDEKYGVSGVQQEHTRAIHQHALRYISSSDSYIRRMTLVMQTPVLVVNMVDKAGLKIPDAPKAKVQWGRLLAKQRKKRG